MMPLEGHIDGPFDCYQPRSIPPPVLLPGASTVASSSPAPPLRPFQTAMDDDLLSLYRNRLLSLLASATPSPSSSYSANAVHPKLEEDGGSPFLLYPGADLRDHLTQQQLQGLTPPPPPPPSHHQYRSSFPASLQLCGATPQVFDETLFQRPEGESTTEPPTRASSVSVVGYEYEDDPEASCRTTTTAVLHGDSLLAALGAFQHQHQPRYYDHHPATMLHDSAAADSLLSLDAAAALGFIPGGARPPPFTSDEGAAAANGDYMMMIDHPCPPPPPPAPGFWTGADNSNIVAAFGKRSRHQRGHTSEKQRRVQISEKFLALRALLPNSTKSDKSSIIKDATDYITELLRHVDKLKLLVHRKHLSTLEEPNAGTAHTRSLRSSFVQRSSNGTCVDVRVLEDEVNIKFCQRRPRSGSLLLVTRGLLEMQLELLHLTSANIDSSLIIWINAKIQVGSSVHATFVASNLVDIVNGN